MSEQNIGAVVVTTCEAVVALFTERDLLNRVVAQGLDVKKLAWVRSVAVILSLSTMTIAVSLRHERWRLMAVIGYWLIAMGALSVWSVCSKLPTNWRVGEQGETVLLISSSGSP